MNSLKNNRKYGHHINKLDKVEPIGVKYYTYSPDTTEEMYFDTKAALFDYIEQQCRINGLSFDDFEMFRIVNQKLIS